MATKKPAKSKSLYKSDDMLQDKDGINLAYDKDTFTFRLHCTNPEIGNNYFIKHALKAELKDDLKWTDKVLPDGKSAFVIEPEHIEKLYATVTNARQLSQNIMKAKEDLKQTVAFDLGLTDDKVYFKNVIGQFKNKETGLIEYERHNGEILGMNRYYVFQKAGIAKTGEHAGKQFVNVHKAQTFLHGPQDWAAVEESLGHRFGVGEMVSILYQEKGKAIVQDYIPSQSREQAPQQRQQFSQAM